jgi:hypothetical protein
MEPTDHDLLIQIRERLDNHVISYGLRLDLLGLRLDQFSVRLGGLEGRLWWLVGTLALTSIGIIGTLAVTLFRR